ncbi:MAG: hypothetical protein H0V88_03830, partial [Pyrinomonadaceae bacterium]|nr:hypothetical protein [Pyrinomonadaceae bacterium]
TQKNPLAVGKSDTQTGGISNRVNVQEAKEFKVIIEMRNMPDEVRNALKPGMTADATIVTKVKQNVLAVPLTAIIEKAPTPPAGASSPVPGSAPAPTPVDHPKTTKGVYILENNKVKFVEVTTGIASETDIEITNGLAPNTTVITGPTRVFRNLKDGTVVKPQTRKPGAGGNANSNGGGRV